MTDRLQVIASMNRTFNIALCAADTLAGETLVSQLETGEFDGKPLPITGLSLVPENPEAPCDLEFHGEAMDFTLAEALDFSEVSFFIIPAYTPRNVELLSRAVESGCVVIDASRGAAVQGYTVPVMPGLNEHFLAEVAENRYAVMPSTAVAPLLPLLQAIHCSFVVSRLSVTVMEPASSLGREGVDRLRKQTVELLNGKPVEGDADDRQAYNVVPTLETDDSGNDMPSELSLVLDEQVDVRVMRALAPVFFGHSFVVDMDMMQPVDLDELKSVLQELGGVSLMDDDERPTVERIAGTNDIAVGGFRQGGHYSNGLSFWVAADSLNRCAVHAVELVGLLIKDLAK